MLGSDEAATLMEHLPPVGWADVATTRDLAELDRRLDMRFDSLADRLRAEFHREQRNLVLAMVASNATLAAIAFGAARLT